MQPAPKTVDRSGLCSHSLREKVGRRGGPLCPPFDAGEGHVVPVLLFALFLITGCSAPSARLTFPDATTRSPQGWFYNVHHHSPADFALLADANGRLTSAAYDDAGEGGFGRVYRLADYANESVPHLIVLLDSIPFDAIAARYRAGDFRMFDPPQKVIPPFPSLTEICYSRLLGCPPLPGIVDDYYDRESGRFTDTMWRRLIDGYQEPWERKLSYSASMTESGLSYLHPREWYAAELARSKAAFDASPNRVTLVYFASASSMVSRFGKPGLDEVLDGIQRMCVQILYERQGAAKITLLADHGHNLMRTANISLDPALAAAGFHVNGTLAKPNDVAIELHGLVTYAGLHTTRPAAVAAAVCKCPQVTLATYLSGDRVIVRNAKGEAAIECREGKLRYVPIDSDVLGYSSLVDALRSQGKEDSDGFASDADWFTATLDQEYPDAPRRLWDAFHGAVTHPPDVMVTIRDGFCCGRDDFERFIQMASTHGSLNQVNSATFVMSMTGRAKAPLRTGDVMNVIEPGYVPIAR